MPFDNESNPHCNVAKMTAVAGAIASDPHSLDMSRFWPVESATSHCGTAQCIGGWSIKLFGQDDRDGDPDRFAAEILGLSDMVANDLFYVEATIQLKGGGIDPQAGLLLNHLEYEDVTPEHAIQAIHNVIKKGDPDWPAIIFGDKYAV